MSGESHSALGVVERQMTAYNDGDAEAFARCYGEDAVVATFSDGREVAVGRDEIREQWKLVFDEEPDVHAELVDHLRLDGYVVCQERVTGIETPTETLAVYLVEDGLIRRLWLGE